MDHPVEYEGKPIGRASMERQGLYYCVSCCCELPGEEMYRLMVQIGEKKADLGILLPEGSSFGIKTRFPVSRVGEGAPTFYLQPKDGVPSPGRFVPIVPEEPFPEIAALRNAVLEEKDGAVGISVPEQPE